MLWKNTSNMLKNGFLLALILEFAVCMITNIQAQSGSDYYFKQISTKDGLSQSRVRCMLIDKKGTIWIGSESGLNCFDNNELRKYSHGDKDSLSLPSNQINFIAEDSLSNIWISTEYGLALYNREQDNFKRIVQNGNYLYTCSCVMLKDGVLFGGNGAFYKYHYQSKQITTMYPQKDTDVTSSLYQMDFLTPDLVIANTRWYGVYSYHIPSNTFLRMKQFEGDDYMTMLIDSQKQVWLSYYGKGLYCYTPEGKLLHHFTTTNSELTHNVICDLKERGDELWIATDGGGISVLSLKDYTFRNIEHVTDDLSSLSCNSILCLYNDRQNNMWLGSIRDGLIGIKEVFIKTFQNVPVFNPYGLSNKTVISLFQDTDGSVWMGTDGGGLNRFDPATGRFSHYPTTSQAKIISMEELNKNELLLSLYNQGLYVFNKQTGLYRKLIIIDEKTDEKLSLSAFAIYIDKVGTDKILICADKLYLYDIGRKTFQVVAARRNVSLKSPAPILNDGKHTYLLSKTELYQWNQQSHSFRTIYTVEPNEFMYDGCRDQQGNFWLGATSGLWRIDAQTLKATKVDTELFGEVTSLTVDNQGRLWVGTRNMLFVYLIKSGNFIVLGESDGVFPNEYIPQSNLISQSGDIYMGGATGMLRINQAIRFDTNSDSPIRLSDVYLNGAPMFDKWDKEKKEITIPYNFRSLQLKMNPVGNDVFQTYAYQYTIEGVNNETFQSYSPNLRINLLPAGTYKIRVSYNSKKGGWTQAEEILTIHVAAPWWRTFWFLLLLLLAFAGIVCGIAFYFVRKRKIKQRWELELIKQKVYEEKVRFLINVNHELRTPLTLIYEPLKRILNKHEDDKELNSQLTGVYRQARRMKNIINMVLDIRRMEVVNDSLHISMHSVNDWIQAITGDFINEFNAKDIQLVCHPDETVCEIPFDKEKCEIVLTNLLINALKFSESGTCVVVDVRKCDKDEYIRISVTDQGIGIKDVDINKLFTRFYQGAYQQTGSGIGLAYSKNLIEMHGGHIGAMNNEDKGACFYFELPLRSEKPIQIPQKEYLNELYCELPNIKNIEEANFDFRKYSLLIVEDEDELRRYLKENLREHFLHVYTAGDGEEGYRITTQYQPDIVVSDVMMPVCNGMEMCKKIKENLEVSHTPIVLLTALNDTESFSFGYKQGADAYLTKPFDMEVLQTVMATHLRNRERMRMRYKTDVSMVAVQEMTFSNSDEQFLLKLNEFVQKNIADNELNVETVSRAMGMGRTLLYNKIKALTDMGLVDYINKLRIDRACFLLSHSDKTITEISEEVGFTTQRYFSKVFKEMMKLTPSQFKQNK